MVTTSLGLNEGVSEDTANGVFDGVHVANTVVESIDGISVATNDGVFVGAPVGHDILGMYDCV